MTDHLRPEDLYLYLEGELGAFDAEHLEEHLETCPDCRRALAERRLLHEGFTSLPPFEVPRGFAAAVLERLPAPKLRKAPWLMPLIAAAASLATGLVGFYLFTGTTFVDLLIGWNRFSSALAGRVLPLAVKTLKLGGILTRVISDLLSMGLQGLTTFTRVLGPAGTIIALGLALLLVSFLVFLGTRKSLHQGEEE